MREIGLGPMLGDSYVITDGLSEGEEIVTRGPSVLMQPPSLKANQV